MKYDKSQWTKLMHWMDLYHEDDNLSDCQLMERGFRHAIEVLEEWYSNNGGREGGLPHVGQAIHQLKLYAAKEEPNETD